MRDARPTSTLVALCLLRLAIWSTAGAFGWALSEWWSLDEVVASTDYPGPSASVVSVSISPAGGENLCLARRVLVLDDRGATYPAPLDSCSTFVVMLDAGALFAGLSIATSIPFTFEVGVDEGE